MEDYPVMERESLETTKTAPSRSEEIYAEHLIAIRKAWFKTQDMRLIRKLNRLCKNRKVYTPEQIIADVTYRLTMHCKRSGITMQTLGCRAAAHWVVEDCIVSKKVKA